MYGSPRPLKGTPISPCVVRSGRLGAAESSEAEPSLRGALMRYREPPAVAISAAGRPPPAPAQQNHDDLNPGRRLSPAQSELAALARRERSRELE